MFSSSKKTVRSKIRRPRPAFVPQCEALEERMLLSTLAQAVSVASQFVRPGDFQSFTAVDASGDDTPGTAFKGGALRIDYSIAPLTLASTHATLPAQGPVLNQGPLTGPLTTTQGALTTNPFDLDLGRVDIEAWQGTTKVGVLGSFSQLAVSEGLINLANSPSLSAGTFTIKATAFFQNGTVRTAPEATIQIKNGTVVNGDFTGQTFDLAQMSGDGIVVWGGGGTDTLTLQTNVSQIASINGMTLAAFSPTAGGQAIYQGLVVDYMRLTDGREVYFTGIERLHEFAVLPHSNFLATRTIDLAITPNDPDFKKQWNLQITDVPDAWRFTQGSDKILLVSLDTGYRPTSVSGTASTGIDLSRLITDPGDDDNRANPGHGHQAISVMIGTPNDNAFHAGINWLSKVYVTDVYHDNTLQQAISDALAYADANGLKAVFQGGIQGEFWLSSGGDLASLENLMSGHSHTALFAIAAGNGNVDINTTDWSNASVQAGLSGGVARLQTNHANVMSVGALQHTAVTVNGLENASAVNRASYSNFGPALTLMAPTDSPATDFFGGTTFGGTSCANPNLAAMASLVWSANPNLTAEQVRTILQVTAMDIGATGKDNEFGSGLVNADAAVRRAVALGRDPALANMYLNPAPFLVSAGVISSSVLASLTQHFNFNLVIPPGVPGDAARGTATSGLSLTPAALDCVFASGPLAAPRLFSEVMPGAGTFGSSALNATDDLRANMSLFARWTARSGQEGAGWNQDHAGGLDAAGAEGVE
jgi:hypothetical protein